MNMAIFSWVRLRHKMTERNTHILLSLRLRGTQGRLHINLSSKADIVVETRVRGGETVSAAHS